MFLAIYEGPIEVGTGLLIALIAIALVFAVLLIIIGSINILKLAGKKSTVKEEVKKPAPAVAKNTEIKDEDMMVAALVATIDYANETKKDVKLVSIKQIG